MQTNNPNLNAAPGISPSIHVFQEWSQVGSSVHQPTTGKASNAYLYPKPSTIERSACERLVGYITTISPCCDPPVSQIKGHQLKAVIVRVGRGLHDPRGDVEISSFASIEPDRGLRARHHGPNSCLGLYRCLIN